MNGTLSIPLPAGLPPINGKFDFTTLAWSAAGAANGSAGGCMLVRALDALMA